MSDRYKTKGQLIREIEDLRRYISELERNEEEKPWPEKALHELEIRYQSLIETNLYGIQEIDIYGIITFMNPVLYTILGYEEGELRGKQIWDMLATDADREDLTDYLTRVAEGDYTPFPWHGTYIRSDGAHIQLKVDWNARKDSHGRVMGFVSVISDILEYNKTDEPSDEHAEMPEQPDTPTDTDQTPDELATVETLAETMTEPPETSGKGKLPDVMTDFSQLIHTSVSIDERLDEIQQMLVYLHKEFLEIRKNDSQKDKAITNLTHLILKKKGEPECLTDPPQAPAQPQGQPESQPGEILQPVMESSDIYEKISLLYEEFQNKWKHDTHKNKIIDKLHEDLQEYKNDFLKKYLRSIIMDVIQIIDNIRKLAEHYRSQNQAENDQVKLLGILESIPSDLEDLFYRHGVKPFVCEEDTFDPTRQRVLKTIETSDNLLDKTVAESLRPGYEWDGKVIRPEMVAAYVYKEEKAI